MPNRTLSISIDPSTFVVTITADTDSTVFHPTASIVCRFQDPGQTSCPRVVAVFSGAGGGTDSQWTLNNSNGYWESPSITSGSTNGTEYTQYVKIHALVRKTAESEESSASPFVNGLGLQPIIRDARVYMELIAPGSAPSEPEEFRYEQQV